MRITNSVLLLIGLTTTAAAEEAAEPAPAAPAVVKTKTISIDGGIALPTGDFSDAVGFGIGALARFEMPLNEKLVLTARAGYIQHLSKEGESMFGGDVSSSASQIPLVGGVRYVFSQKPTSQLYGAGELGFVMFRMTNKVGEMSESNSDTNLGMTIGGGYRSGKLDLRAGLLFPDVGEIGDVMALMATVGYDITTL